MDSHGLTVRESGEWVKRKHHFLRRYCDMFITSMKKKWSLTYLDLLAGPGVCQIRDTKELVPGSPFVALDFPFDRFLYYEANVEVAAALKERVTRHEYSDRCKVETREWQEVVLAPGFRLPSGLILAFIDPTGISQVPWTAIEALASASSRIDILMTIQHGMGITLNQHQSLAKDSETAVDAFLGGAEWRSRLPTSGNFCQAVLEAFTERMSGLGFSTRKWMLVKNNKGQGLYYLCLFSRNPVAIRFWDEVVKKDETGQRTLGF